MGRSPRNSFLKQMLSNQQEHNRERTQTQLNRPVRRAAQKRRSFPEQSHEEARRRGGSPIVFRSKPRSEPRPYATRSYPRSEPKSEVRREPIVKRQTQPGWMMSQDEPTSSGERKRQRTSSAEAVDTPVRGPTCARSHPKVGVLKDPEVVDLLEEDIEGGGAPRSPKPSHEPPTSPSLTAHPAKELLPSTESELATPQISSHDKPSPSRKPETNEPAFQGLKGDGILLTPWVDDDEKPSSGGTSFSPVLRRGDVGKKAKEEDEPWHCRAEKSIPVVRTYHLRGRNPPGSKSSSPPEVPETLGIGRFLSSVTSEQRQILEDLQVEYPRGMPGAVLLRFCDLKRLEPSEFLNDNIIEFYIKYMVQELERDEHYKKQLNRCHFFNSYLFEKVNRDGRAPDGGCPGYASVKTWTKNVDLFGKDFLFFPIHEVVHWSLVVVCHPRAAFVKLGEEEAKKKSPCLLHLDSMGGDGHNTDYVCGRIRKYLECEWEDKRRSLDEIPALVRREAQFDVKRMDVPLQGASVDCGLFILAYIEYFVHALPSSIHIDSVENLKDVHSFKYFLSPKWFPRREAFHLRVHLRKILVTLLFSQYENQEVRILVGKLMDMCDSHKYAGPKAVENRNSVMFVKSQKTAEKKRKPSKKSSEDDKQSGCRKFMRAFMGRGPNNSEEGTGTARPDKEKNDIATNSHVDMASVDGKDQGRCNDFTGRDQRSDANGNAPGPSLGGEPERGEGPTTRQNEKGVKEDFIDLVVEDDDDDMEIVCSQQEGKAPYQRHGQYDSSPRESSPML